MQSGSTAKIPTPTSASVNNLLAPLIEQHAMKDGVTETGWPGLILGHSSRPMPRFPLLYEPSICVVAQRQKQVYLPDGQIVYDPLHYLVVAVPLPLEAEVPEASPEEPFLGLALQIDMSMVGDLILEMADEEEQSVGRPEGSQSLFVSSMNDGMLNSVARLLRVLDSTLESRILGPGAVKEILFHVLRGKQGHLLRYLAFRDSNSHRVARVVQHLQKTFSQEHDISSIASFAGMSSSTLHHAFEKFVGQPPIQYLKKIRLHRARNMMVGEGTSASEAAYEVGYKSPSQFSREFKRQFGLPPSRAAEII